jgi:hypothetical protein
MHFVRSWIFGTNWYSRWCSTLWWCTYRLVCIYFILLSPVNAFVNNVRFSNRLERIISLIKCSAFAIRRWIWQIWWLGSDWKLSSDSLLPVIDWSPIEIMTCCTVSTIFSHFDSLNFLFISRYITDFTLMFLLVFSESRLSIDSFLNRFRFCMVFLCSFILKSV